MAVSSFTGSTAVVLENTWKYVVSQCFSWHYLNPTEPYAILRAFCLQIPFVFAAIPCPLMPFWGEMGDDFYVLRQGEASVTVHTVKGDKASGRATAGSHGKSPAAPAVRCCQVVGRLGPGDYFGEKALLASAPWRPQVLPFLDQNGSKYGSWANTTSWCYMVLLGVTVLSLDIIYICVCI